MLAAAYVQEERVFVAGRLYALDEIVAHMDSALYYEASEWAGTGATPQAVVDFYVELHQKRHGVPFSPPPPRP